MIVLFSILLFSKSDCALVLCCISLHILIASTRRVQLHLLGYFHNCITMHGFMKDNWPNP